MGLALDFSERQLTDTTVLVSGTQHGADCEETLGRTPRACPACSGLPVNPTPLAWPPRFGNIN